MVNEFIVKNGLITPTLKVGNGTGVNFPTADGTAGQVLITDGNGILSFVDRVVSIDDLSDVDTSSISPAFNDILVWNGSQWSPEPLSIINDTSPQLGGDLDAQSNNVTSVNNIIMDISPTSPSTAEGSMYWDANNHALAIKSDVSETTLQVGQELQTRVYNNTGVTITNGSAVYINGVEGTENRPTIALAVATSATTSAVFGIATHDIANGEFGYITNFGRINGLDTSTFTAGNVLYLSADTPGAFTNAAPSSPNFAVTVGYVNTVDAVNGRIYVRIDSGFDAPAGDATELTLAVRKASAGTINIGQPVVQVGWSVGQGLPLVELADADDITRMPALGIARDTITSSTTGFITIAGSLTGQNTSAFADNDDLYIDTTPGDLTNVRPTSSSVLVQKVGKVLRSHASSGVIAVVGAGRVNDQPNTHTDDIFRIVDSGDVTKVATFEASGITTATTRTYTFPDASGTLQLEGTISIDDLTDVDTSTIPPDVNDILIWNGSQWTPSPNAGGSAQNLWETINSDSGSTTANTTTDTLTVTGGAGISTSISGDTLTITNDIASIDDLSDVDTSTTPPSVNDILVWNGSQWSPEANSGGSTQNLFETVTADGGSTTANSPTDTLIVSGGVGITTAISGDTLTITNDIVSIDDLSDVDTSTEMPLINQILTWNGSQWAPVDLSIINDTTPQLGGNLDAQSNNITSVNNLIMDISPTSPSTAEGSIYWDSNNHALAVKSDVSDTTLQVGQELITRVYNNTGVTITNGSLVYINGAEGVENRATIALAQATSATTSAVFGMATHDIADSSFGYITSYGRVNGLDTSTFTAGDVLYLSADTPGAFTASAPISPNFAVPIGIVNVSDVSSGIVLVSTTPVVDTPAGDATELTFLARKATAGTINPGQVVVQTGWNLGVGVMEIELADADNTARMPAIGIARDTITNSTNGYLVFSGAVTGQNTSGFSEGDELFVSTTPGTLTNVRPTAANVQVQKVGRVLRSNASNGVIAVVGAGRSNDQPNTHVDNIFRIVDSGDTSKVAQFEASGITTATTRTYTFPDASGIIQLEGTISIDDLTDVDTSTIPPSVNDILVWNGSQWSPEANSGGSAQNLWETINSDSGSTTANTTTDTLIIAGGTGISTAIVGDTLTITNDSPNVDQNVFVTFTGDTGSTTANTTTDTLIIAGGIGILTSVVGDVLTIDSLISSIDDLSDVDTSTIPPNIDEVLVWNGSQWVPSNINTLTVSNNATTTITLSSSDNGSVIVTSSGSSITLNLPDSLPIGFNCAVEQGGAGVITFTPTGGATMNNVNGHTMTSGQYAVASVYVKANSDGSSAVYTLMGATA